MSVSTEVQRTLVKSPPELWAELSNPEALARHLGELGAIRITKTEPETKVEWEAEEARGIVQLKQSGWGTKVTLTVTRTPAIPEKPGPEPTIVAESKAEAEVVVEPEPVAFEPEPESIVVQPEPESIVVQPEPEPIVAEPEPEPEMVVEPEPIVEPEPQLGFFARLFRKRKAKLASVDNGPDSQPEAVVPAVSEPKIEVVALAAPESIYPDPPTQSEASKPAEDLASELESLEEQMAAETTALLTGVLDRLGAAHHRPFSRG